jgi:hypothetical protein
MRTPLLRKAVLAAAICAALPEAGAVMLSADGLGQALVFPYYTVQSSRGNPFNTYLSIVNRTPTTKAVRVRVREGRASREVASFNLFLSPNDVWTGAIVPLANDPAARLISVDRSCVSPALGAGAPGDPPGLTFQNAFFSGSSNDGNGTGLDRTREGWVEVIEMATLTGASAAAVTHNSSGVPANCAATQSIGSQDVAAPTGGLSGTLTLINVASGQDFTLNAEALADLSTQSFYRPASDSYPDFAAFEITPVSVVVANGLVYRSTWTRGTDAVSAVLMRSELHGEFVLDPGTLSRTDWVLAFPTRHYYVNTTSAAAPFSRPAVWSETCTAGGETLALRPLTREEQDAAANNAGPMAVCAAVPVFHFGTVGGVLGSLTQGTSTDVSLALGARNGWMRATPPSAPGLTSLGSSTRMSLATGATTQGSHVHAGLPVVGFMVRTFENGALNCAVGTCQGNYGGSFPLQFRRSISGN